MVVTPNIEGNSMIQQEIPGIVMDAWFKSLKSGPNGGNCVEVRVNSETGEIEVRNSKQPEGLVLTFSPRVANSFFEKIEADPNLLADLVVNAAETIIDDEMVLRGLANGGFSMGKKGKEGKLHFTDLELRDFVADVIEPDRGNFAHLKLNELAAA